MSLTRVLSRLCLHVFALRLSPLAVAGLCLSAGGPGCSSGDSKSGANSSSTLPTGSGDSGELGAGSSSSSGAGSSGGGAPVASSSGSGSGSSTGGGGPGTGSSSGGTADAGSGAASSSGGATGSSGAAGSSGSSSGQQPSGASDASAGGDGSFAATGCAGKSYKLCEDFETGTVGSLGPNWTKYAGYGTPGPTDVALANDAAHSGMQSLKSDSIDRGQTRAQRSLTSIGATAYNHWGRIFYKVQEPAPKPQKTATNTVIHITWTSLIGPSGENRVVDIVENMSGAFQWLFNIPSDGCCTSSAYNYTFDSPDGASDWHCAEWWVDVATDSYRFFYDSTEVTSIAFTGKQNSTMSDYTSVVVGATWYQQAGTILSPFVIWFDDLAIDDNRIGCQ